MTRTATSHAGAYRRGSASLVLPASQDLDQISELADRIVVIFDRQIVFETTAGAADRLVIGRHMAGH